MSITREAGINFTDKAVFLLFDNGTQIRLKTILGDTCGTNPQVSLVPDLSILPR